MDEPTTAQEVKPLREPQRLPEHCGRPMRKFSSVSPSNGALLTVWTCEACGAHQRTSATP